MTNSRLDDNLVHERPRVFNVRDKRAGAVYVGRPSKWGNPFRIGRDGTRAQVIDRYANWIQQQPQLLASLQELAGRDLCCHCAPEQCHADVLLAMANG